jgi:hypothetical protein
VRDGAADGSGVEGLTLNLADYFGELNNEALNLWLEKEKNPTRYQFNMLSPKSYSIFFQKLREGGVAGFRSDLDVAMTKAAKLDR